MSSIEVQSMNNTREGQDSVVRPKDEGYWENESLVPQIAMTGIVFIHIELLLVGPDWRIIGNAASTVGEGDI